MRYSSVFIKLVKDSLFRFKKDAILILATGMLGAFFQICAIGQIIYYARALERAQTLDILGYHIEARSAYSFSICIAVLFLLLLLSAFLVYYSRSKIIALACSYESFCSKRVFSIIAYLRGLCSPGILSLYDNRMLLLMARSDARFCGRILRMLIMLIQPSATFIVALAALLYINFVLTISVLFIMGISMFFHYRNNLKGVSSSRKMELHSSGAAKEKLNIMQAATRLNCIDDDFFEWMGERFTKGEINQNVEAYQGRFQTIEEAKFINDIVMAVMLFLVVIVLGGNALINNAHWGRLIIYLLALRYCLNHLKTTIITFTSINRFYPQFSRYFQFLDSFDGPITQKDSHVGRYKIKAQSSPLEDSSSSVIIENGHILALAAPFEFNFYDLPTLLKCLLGQKQGSSEKLLRTTNVIAETNCYLEGLTFRELFCFPPGYDQESLQQDLRACSISEAMISRLPEDLNKPISREKWDHIDPEIRYSLALLSAIHSSQQWIVIDKEVLKYISRRSMDHLQEKLQGKITLIVFDEELDKVGTYGEKTVAIIDGHSLIGLGDVHWFESQKENIQEKMDSAKRRVTRIQKKGKDEEDDELDDDI
jgi:ABC-type multidrug transport system fused ATPase/permease subunit